MKKAIGLGFVVLATLAGCGSGNAGGAAGGGGDFGDKVNDPVPAAPFSSKNKDDNKIGCTNYVGFNAYFKGLTQETTTNVYFDTPCEARSTSGTLGELWAGWTCLFHPHATVDAQIVFYTNRLPTDPPKPDPPELVQLCAGMQGKWSSDPYVPIF
jgi:hypothetical protein